MKMKRALLGMGSAAVLLLCGLFLFDRYKNAPWSGPKPNILVISLCSLRQDVTPFMQDGLEANMPQVAKFFAPGAFVFPNAFNGLGWTGLFTVTGQRLKAHWWESIGYRLAGLWIRYQMYLVPARHSWGQVTEEEKRKGIQPDSNFEKNYKDSLDYLVRSIEGPSQLPFFVIAHIKYPHFPLIDRYNADSGWDRFLDPAEKERVRRYLSEPEKFPAKIPFLLMLTNDDKILRSHPQIQDAMRAAHDDGAHDTAFLGLLTGDHGELQMERGQLTHGVSWHDEGLRIPLLARFPGQKSREVIHAQTNFFSVTKMIEGLAQGRVTTRNFTSRMKQFADPILVMRDCANTWRGLREGNRWKYAVDNATGESFVFDLSKDPEERANLAPSRPDLVDKLEKKYWEALPNYIDQSVNTCEPWPGKEKKNKKSGRY